MEGSSQRHHISFEEDANYLCRIAQASVEETPIAKRRKLTSKDDTRSPASNNRHGKIPDPAPLEALEEETRRTLPSTPENLGYDDLDLPEDDDRSQTFVPDPSNNRIRESPSVEEPQTPVGRCASRMEEGNSPQNYGYSEDSGRFENSLPSPPPTGQNPRRQSRLDMPSQETTPLFRFWILVSERPVKHWKNHRAISLPDESLDSFLVAITDLVDLAAFSTIDVTMRTQEEAWTFSLPRNDGDHFDSMKDFMLLKAQPDQNRLQHRPETVDVFVSVSAA